ncbi:MAG TPA: hypothetical protein PLK34_00800 [Candidatus Pacearchaeota archaeon]|nr:hypothetical protein [Candidatus Pacearchaeota archaeon]
MAEEIRFEVIKKITELGFKYRNLNNISKLDTNSPPSVFIGSALKYPLVNVGILSPLEKDENAWVYDDTKYWANNDFKIHDVIKLRESLLNSRFQSKIYDTRTNNNKFLQIARDIAIASKPVDVEIELKNKLNINSSKDRVVTPHGMKGSLKQARITDNVSVNQKLDRVMGDEIKAAEGLKYLYKNSFDSYTLSKILSVGVLGLTKNKKLVPTRWSITATDDTLGKNLIKEVKEYKWIENYEVFLGEFLGNQYLILLFPSVFSFELFELYLPRSSWNPTATIKASTDYEGYSGRKEYASSTAGGYYATRLSILEYLSSVKKQAAILAIRLETPSYWAALGVWVVRESVRKAMNNRKLEFDNLPEFIESAKKIGKAKFDFDCSPILEKSKLLTQIKTQTRLQDYF